MIRPPAAQSMKTFERVFKATGSVQEAADAVAAAAVAYSHGLLGPIGNRQPQGALHDVDRDLLPEIVIREVCGARQVSAERLLAGARQRPVVRARHEIMWILCEDAGFTTREAAEALQLGDHSSVSYGIEAARARCETVAGVADEVRSLVERIRAAVASPAEERRAA